MYNNKNKHIEKKNIVIKIRKVDSYRMYIGTGKIETIFCFEASLCWIFLFHDTYYQYLYCYLSYIASWGGYVIRRVIRREITIFWQQPTSLKYNQDSKNKGNIRTLNQRALRALQIVWSASGICLITKRDRRQAMGRWLWST